MPEDFTFDIRASMAAAASTPEAIKGIKDPERTEILDGDDIVTKTIMAANYTKGITKEDVEIVVDSDSQIITVKCKKPNHPAITQNIELPVPADAIDWENIKPECNERGIQIELPYTEEFIQKQRTWEMLGEPYDPSKYKGYDPDEDPNEGDALMP